jgi:hypothetical protein
MKDTRAFPAFRAIFTIALFGGVLLGSSCRAKPITNVNVIRTDARTPQGSIDDPGDAGQKPDLGCAKLDKQAGDPCSCDGECATGFCQAGVCCGGAACDARPAGAACQRADQCDSGFCADGVCCNVACNGACVSCKLPDREGECVSVPAGQPDVHNVCRKDAPESCGQSGLCNGQGGCAKYSAGSPCSAGSCDGTRMLVPASECDGEGNCMKGTAIDCAPFLCDGTACSPNCTDNSQCIAPAQCQGGSCGKKGNGQKCAGAADCISGFCVDGVCCNSACTGNCQYCASASALGTCTPTRAGAVDPRGACVDQGSSSCGTTGRCDGSGACEKYKNGTVCRAGRCEQNANTETGAGTCSGGACKVPAARSCAPYQGCSGTHCVAQCGSDNQCAGGSVCVDGSCGKRPVGAQCTRNQDCGGPGICAQGRCCATACGGACTACNLEGSEGTCAPVPLGGADPSGTCRNDVCNNGCDGNGGCLREKPGTSCQAAACTPAGLTSYTCTAEGACLASTTPCPTGQTCMDNRCVAAAKAGPGESCLLNGDCQSNACVNNRCCTSACATGPCRACTAATGWKCQEATDGAACGDGRTCLNGACAKKATGAVCGAGGECTSGSCIDGHCCAGACAETPCRSCPAASQFRCTELKDETACGGAGARVCRGGACVAPCPAGQIQCGGACVNPQNDPNHCGGCNLGCMGTPCTKGKCGTAPDECKGVLVRCDGMCVNVKNNDQHCGGCNIACKGLTPRCRQGTCSLL